MVAHTTRLLFSLLIVASTLIPQVVWAEESDVEARINRLHEEAIEAYFNMEMDQAIDLLERALGVAEREGVGDSLVARVRLTYATVLVLGLNRLTDGRDQMVAALQADPTIEPDPHLTAPLVDQLWQDVRSEHAPSGGDGQDDEEAVVQFGQVSIEITPVEEQLPGYAIPIYVELSQAANIGRVLLAYRGPDMRRFLKIQMTPHGEGYAGRIACHRVAEPEVEYYIEVLDTDGEVVARAGSEEEPLRVAVRGELERDPPHLPGEPPEPPCSEDEREEEVVEAGTRSRIMYFEVGVGTGAGVPASSQAENVSCNVGGTPQSDRITITPAVAWTELVIFPEIGFYIGPHVAIGVRARLGIPGAIYPGAPLTWGVLGRVRWFVLPEDPFRLSLHIGGGYASVSHPITLQGAVNCIWEYEYTDDRQPIYHRLAGPGLIQIGGEFLWDVHRHFGIGVELDLSILVPDFAFQGDLFFVLDVSF